MHPTGLFSLFAKTLWETGRFVNTGNGASILVFYQIENRNFHMGPLHFSEAAS